MNTPDSGCVVVTKHRWTPVTRPVQVKGQSDGNIKTSVTGCRLKQVARGLKDLINEIYPSRHPISLTNEWQKQAELSGEEEYGEIGQLKGSRKKEEDYNKDSKASANKNRFEIVLEIFCNGLVSHHA